MAKNTHISDPKAKNLPQLTIGVEKIWLDSFWLIGATN